MSGENDFESWHEREEIVDRMWDAHILACLAIISAWSEEDGET